MKLSGNKLKRKAMRGGGFSFPHSIYLPYGTHYHRMLWKLSVNEFTRLLDKCMREKKVPWGLLNT